MAAVVLLLLVTCANVAGLLVTRASARAHEFGVRLALGAGRARVVRQLTVESLVLAFIGGGLGILMAVGSGAMARRPSRESAPAQRESDTGLAGLALRCGGDGCRGNPVRTCAFMVCTKSRYHEPAPKGGTWCRRIDGNTVTPVARRRANRHSRDACGRCSSSHSEFRTPAESRTGLPPGPSVNGKHQSSAFEVSHLGTGRVLLQNTGLRGRRNTGCRVCRVNERAAPGRQSHQYVDRAD